MNKITTTSGKTFYVDCSENELEEATKIANQLAQKLVEKASKADGISFGCVGAMRQCLLLV